MRRPLATTTADVTPPPRMRDDVGPADLRFRLGTGRPALDLLATIGERRGRNFDRLRHPQDLAQWLYEARLLDGRPATTASHLAEVRGLRRAVDVAVSHRMAGDRLPGWAVAELNHRARDVALAPQLVAGREGATNALRWFAPDPVSGALGRLARDAVELLATAEPGRLRECAADDCSLVFYDASGPARRRWCSMSTCGNRAKVGRYRARARSTPGPLTGKPPRRRAGSSTARS